jgi:hypothetical protein
VTKAQASESTKGDAATAKQSLDNTESDKKGVVVKPVAKLPGGKSAAKPSLLPKKPAQPKILDDDDDEEPIVAIKPKAKKDSATKAKEVNDETKQEEQKTEAAKPRPKKVLPLLKRPSLITTSKTPGQCCRLCQCLPIRALS